LTESVKEYIKYIGFFVILAVAAFGSIELLKTSMGVDYPLMVVVSESMQPTLNVGDFILVSGIKDFDNVVALPPPNGEILVFKRNDGRDEYIVHRAIDKNLHGEEWYYTTKGDHNKFQDMPPAMEHNILGKVSGNFPILGYFPLFIKTTRGFILVASLMFIIFFADNIIPKKNDVSIGGKFPWYVIIPYIAAPLAMMSFWFIRNNHGYIDFIALGFWYIGSALTPFAFDDDDTGMMFWLYHFVLTIIPIGCDIVWWTQGINPMMWWGKSGSTIPITGLFQQETVQYVQAFNQFALYVVPAVLIFILLTAAKRRGDETILEISKRIRQVPESISLPIEDIE